MSSRPRTVGVARARAHRLARGAALLEYLVLVSFVAVPCILASVGCFIQLALWYTHFIDAVSLPTP